MNHTSVVVTGVGMITPLGGTSEETWQALLRRRSALRRLRPEDFSVRLPGDRNRFRRTAGPPCGAPAVARPACSQPLDPALQLATVAAAEAWHAARPQLLPRDRIGCVIGTSKGGLAAATGAFADMRNNPGNDSALDSPASVLSPLPFTQIMPNAAAAAIAGHYDLRGPCLAPVAACATGLAACLRGAELIREGRCDMVLAGAADASLHPAVIGSFSRLGVLSKRFENPESACRPFHRDRDGFVIGEGAAVIVLESEDSAARRHAPILARWDGGVQASDPSGLTTVDEHGESLVWALRTLLDKTGLHTHDVDYINYHGTGTILNDRAEAHAVRAVFGDSAAPPGSSLKGALGHLLGAAGAVELGLTILALRDGCLPPTLHLDAVDPEFSLDFLRDGPRETSVNHAVKISLGFGGVVNVAALSKADASQC